MQYFLEIVSPALGNLVRWQSCCGRRTKWCATSCAGVPVTLLRSQFPLTNMLWLASLANRAPWKRLSTLPPSLPLHSEMRAALLNICGILHDPTMIGLACLCLRVGVGRRPGLVGFRVSPFPLPWLRWAWFCNSLLFPHRSLSINSSRHFHKFKRVSIDLCRNVSSRSWSGSCVSETEVKVFCSCEEKSRQPNRSCPSEALEHLGRVKSSKGLKLCGY